MGATTSSIEPRELIPIPTASAEAVRRPPSFAPRPAPTTLPTIARPRMPSVIGQGGSASVVTFSPV